MAVKQLDWELSKRGLADAARHREKKKEAIRKNIAEIIGDTSIITRRKGQIVKVPIRGLKSYRFIFRRESEGGKGVGQGEGEKGKWQSPDFGVSPFPLSTLPHGASSMKICMVSSGHHSFHRACSATTAAKRAG